ncbi:uncharacterized protein LOC130719522 [Lotus japonicus]|uniref:uncharacterized protein LOC130719522 n=1 Tax=Lotus japonicus TaxID=34305 RepID=UPI00258B1E41|nr:uncharacterized protein LOC130719522 [Lotus japonicus]
MQKWNEVVYVETTTHFEEEWREMCDMCKDHPKFTSYIYDTWAESAHASLKKMFWNNKGDLCDSWEAVDRLTIVRHNAIQASFEHSINIVEHRFKSPMYKNMRGFVAKHALQLMYDEQNRFWGHGQSMLRRKLKELYYPQISSLCPPEVKIKHKQSFKERKTKPPREQEAKASKRKPRLLKTPKTTIQSSTPKSQAPKSKNKKAMKTTGATTNIYLPELPSFFWQYIHEVIDVVGYGNGGYKAVAALLGLENGQDGWPWVREALIAKLTLYRKHYTYMWGNDVVQAMHLRLTLPFGGRATEDKWMHLPEMGYLIAN